MKIGQLVILIKGDGFMPPLGSIGEIVSEIDCYGEYDVLFPHHPCPVPPDISWVAHKSWLIPVGDARNKLIKTTSALHKEVCVKCADEQPEITA